MSAWRRLADWCLDRSVGYGLKSYRVLFFYFVPMLLLCWWLFSLPGALQRSADHAGAGADQQAGPTAATPFWVALQTNLAMIPVLPAKNWAPAPHFISVSGRELRGAVLGREVGLTYEGAAAVPSLLSYVAVPLFLAGIAGILKKEK